ncbi:hypothetical protein INT45_006197 [Circinella minor]|uniref:HMG box domain-containing protein n=1 Tax=Circinella minor TaxID=1195481 RepID=A0A8H7RU46_9FUNG|nr:hypothetical protein INT45_006197 [Circinella minor]
MYNFHDNLPFGLSYADLSQQPSLEDLHNSSLTTHLHDATTVSTHQPNVAYHPAVPTTTTTQGYSFPTTMLQQATVAMPPPPVPQQHQPLAYQPTMTTTEVVLKKESNNRENSYSPPCLIDQQSQSQSQQQMEAPIRVTRPPNAFLLFNKEMRKQLKDSNPTMKVAEISKEIGERWKNLSSEDKSRYVSQANSIKETQRALHPNSMYIRRSKAELAKAGHYAKLKRKAAAMAQEQQQQQDSSASSTPTSTMNESNPLFAGVGNEATGTGGGRILGAMPGGVGIGNGPSHHHPQQHNPHVHHPHNPYHHHHPQHYSTSTMTSFASSSSSAASSTSLDTLHSTTNTTNKQQRKRHRRDKNPDAPKHPLSAYMWFLTEVRPETMQTYPGSTVGQISKLCADRWNNMDEQERLPWHTKAQADKERYAREMQIYASQHDHPMGRGTRQKYRAAAAAAAAASVAANNSNNTSTTTPHGMTPSSPSCNTSNISTPQLSPDNNSLLEDHDYNQSNTSTTTANTTTAITPNATAASTSFISGHYRPDHHQQHHHPIHNHHHHQPTQQHNNHDNSHHHNHHHHHHHHHHHQEQPHQQQQQQQVIHSSTTGQNTITANVAAAMFATPRLAHQGG